ncbi:hypothetical protein [Nonomuraea sp. NPDC049758]|uniref:hypothetical protein n=1 Tax=Nonomuraea sp. NPDC049758 TaxID=3154360 RepID=UPI003449BE1C
MTDALPDPVTFPMPRATDRPFDPSPELTRRSAEAPVSRVRLWDGTTPWLVTRYDDVRAVLADPRAGVDVAEPGFPHTNAVSKARDARMKTLMQMDAPEHTAHRRLLTADFMIRKMEALRPRIQRIVDDLLAGSDLVRTVALPVPAWTWKTASGATIGVRPRPGWSPPVTSPPGGTSASAACASNTG